MQVLIDSRYKNVYGGRATTDSEITGLLIAILFAGQHTSSVTSSWTGYRMLSNRKWFEVRGCREVCGGLELEQGGWSGVRQSQATACDAATRIQLTHPLLHSLPLAIALPPRRLHRMSSGA